MITLIILIFLYKMSQMRKAWNYSKALFDKDYIKNQIIDTLELIGVVVVIWLFLKLDVVLILFDQMF